MKIAKDNEKLLIKILKDKYTTEENLELFNTILPIGYKISLDVLKHKFYSLPLESEDLYSIIYRVYVDTVNWFKLTKENPHKFLDYFSYKTKNEVINECRKYISNGERILNTKMIVTDEQNFECENVEFADDKTAVILWEILRCANTDQQKVLKLKLFGYCTDEIAMSLNRSRTWVDYQIATIKKDKNILLIYNNLIK